MFFYILKRVLATIPVMVIVAIFVFLLLRLTPGDPAAILAGDAATPAQIERIRDSLMSRYYFSFTYIFKTFLANLSWVEFKRVMKSGFNYILFRVKKSLHR